jgi:DNA polymerase III epsilon subunit-like protein
MRFYSLDVETANPDQSTICQIGVGIWDDGILVDTWKSYIDPQDFFHWRFIELHGITHHLIASHFRKYLIDLDWIISMSNGWIQFRLLEKLGRGLITPAWPW